MLPMNDHNIKLIEFNHLNGRRQVAKYCHFGIRVCKDNQ